MNGPTPGILPIRRLRPSPPAVVAIMTLAIVVLAFLMLYPVLWLVSTSLKSPDEIASNGLSLLPKDLTWSNYVEGWTGLPSVTFGRFFLNSLLIASATVLANTVSCCAAYDAVLRDPALAGSGSAETVRPSGTSILGLDQ